MSDHRVQPAADTANPWAHRPGGLPPMAGGAPEGDAPPPASDGGAAEGQGAGGAEGASGLRPDLGDLAPDVRERVNAVLDEYEGNATKKFQEHAQFRSKFEPYADLPLDEFDPEYLGELLSMSEVFEDEGKFDAWLRQAATERGILGPQGGGADGEDGEDEFDVPQTKAELDAYVQEKIDAAVSPITQHTQAQAEQQAQQEAAAQLDARLDELLKGDGIELEQFDPEDRDYIFTLAMRHPDSEKDPVGKGYEDYKKLTGKAERGVVNNRVGRGRAPEGAGGAPPLDPAERPKDFATAKQMARERVRQAIASR